MSAEYIEVCKVLGIDPEVEFVKLNPDGTIGFTCGKRSEIINLLNSVREAGFTPSPALIAAAER